MSTDKNTENPNTPVISAAPKKRTISLKTAIAALLIVAASAFVLGTRADMYGWLQAGSAGLNLSSVQETYQKLKDQYNGDLNTQALIEGANRGLVEAVGDPYTVYFSQSEASEFLAELEGQFDGIGAEIGKEGDDLTIVTTLDGSPAKSAGLRAGDILASVNDEDAAGWSIEEAVSKIRGQKGTTVKLQVVRGGKLETFTITRETITSPSVTSEIKDNIGIMRISRFGETDTALLAKQAAENFKTKNVKGVVLDLRGNGGGYLDAAVQIASIWLPSDTTVVTERREGEVIDELKTSGEAFLKGIPTVVLIDGGSASASEILAGALRDHNVAKLVGEKTFGKGSVQQIEGLNSGAQLKITIAEWFTPNGKNISRQGINPDEQVARGEIESLDPQQLKALEMLQ